MLPAQRGDGFTGPRVSVGVRVGPAVRAPAGVVAGIGSAGWPRATRLLAVSAALVVLCGCRIGVQVGVEAGPDGRGSVQAVVSLDREAAGAVPDLAAGLRVDDLRAAGWTVQGPRSVGGGG